MPSFTSSLENAIKYGLAVANERSHELATLEHLLLALTHESSAARVIVECNADLAMLRERLLYYINNDLSSLKSDRSDSEAVPTAAFQRVIQRAAIHVQSSGREFVSGRNVLVAVFAERESKAAMFLREQDMTRYDAVNFIAHGVSKRVSNSEVNLELSDVRFIEKPSDIELQDEPSSEQEDTNEHRSITLRLKRDDGSLALLARSIELQVKAEVDNLSAKRPNFRTDEEQKAFARQLDFLEELADSLGELASGLAELGSDSSQQSAEDLSQKTQELRDRVLQFLSKNQDDALFYCAKMPAMLASIALFSTAGAHMTTATPILMALFGGDRIIKLIWRNKQE